MDIGACIKKYLENFFEGNTDRLLTDPILIRAISMIGSYEDNGDLNFISDLYEILEIYENVFKLIGTDILLIIMRQDRDMINDNNIWHKKRDKMEVLQKEEDNYDVFETAIDLIGDITEGTIKYFFRELYQLMYYSRKKEFIEEEKITRLKLGVLNNELLNNCEHHLTRLFQTSLPVKYKFSNWRNLAQHKNYIISDDNIILYFNIKGVETEYVLSIEDIIKYYAEIVRAANIFQIARVMFLTNLPRKVSNQVLNYARKNKKMLPKNKRELLLKDMEIVLSTKELVIDLVDDSKEVVIVTIKDKKKRVDLFCHIPYLTYMLYNVWEIFRRQSVKIKYIDSEAQLCYMISVDQELCKRIEETGNIELIKENFDITIYNV